MLPYEEKDEAKSLGAKWNPELKKWYIQNTKDCGKFMKWIWKDFKESYDSTAPLIRQYSKFDYLFEV